MEFKPKFKSGSDVLQSLFEDGKSPLSEQFIRWKLWARWSDYVGASLAQECEPVGYQRGTLYIWVPNSSALHNLNFLKDQIKIEINKKLKHHFVENIRFTLDRKAVPADSEQKQDLKDFVLKNKKKP